MRKSGDKFGAMQLSFGMIFSIILIIVFIAFAFYAIKIFLGLQEKAKVASFREDLQNEVDRLWKGSFGSQVFNASLPSKIEKVCFKDWQFENLFFEPENAIEGLAPVNIDHINIIKTTQNSNPYCIENKNGKVSMILKKGSGETLVTIAGA